MPAATDPHKRRYLRRTGFPSNAVVDWLSFGGMTFNLADVFLVAAVLLLLGQASREQRSSRDRTGISAVTRPPDPSAERDNEDSAGREEHPEVCQPTRSGLCRFGSEHIHTGRDEE